MTIGVSVIVVQNDVSGAVLDCFNYFWKRKFFQNNKIVLNKQCF